MASITSLQGNNTSTSSLYGNKNIISGLASGLDTESMIQNAVSGYNTKITSLQQKITKTEWQQEAYRGIIDKSAAFTAKYTSFSSSTNLMSASFYTSAVKVSSVGDNADKISATGKTGSDVQILGVGQLATAASYSVQGFGGETGKIAATGALNLSGTLDVSALNGGSLNIQVGDGTNAKTLKISFDSTMYKDQAELYADINKKLEEANKAAGTSVKLNDNGTFSDNGNNGIKITAASDKVAEALGISKSDDSYGNQINVDGGKLVQNPTATDYLKDKKLSVTVDGKTKSIDMNAVMEKAKTAEGANDNERFANALNAELEKTFGAGTVKAELNGDKLNLSVRDGSTLKLSGDAMKALGFDTTSETSYADTSKKLSELSSMGLKANSEGKYEMTLNDVKFTFEADATVNDVINQINKSSAGVSLSYSQTTNQFKFTATETGTAGRIEFGAGENDIAKKLFSGGSSVAGQDAKFVASVNGKVIEMSRSSNTVDIDGMKITMKDTFNGEMVGNDPAAADARLAAQANVTAGKSVSGAVTFKSETDSDKIINAVKTMIEDYNTMVTELKKSFSTMPMQKSNGKAYDPLTEEDMSGMSESAIKAYEEKAKTGLLFMDRDLSNYYSGLVNNMSGLVNDLKSIGITTEFSGGTTTLKLDENAMRNALETNPDKVKDVMAGTANNGAGKDGLMTRLSNTMNQYTKTTGSKGILVNKAGSTLAPSTLYVNTIQKQIDKLNDDVSKWQDKLSDKVDYYTSKFTALETLINNMNSQSSALQGFMGG